MADASAARIRTPAAPGPRRVLVPASHPLERAADRAASLALGSTVPPIAFASPRAAPVGSGQPVPGIVDAVLSREGQPLDTGTRARFEPRFGRDFSNVRIHHDELAHRSTSAVAAAAFSSGRHIVFGRGQWQPDTLRGQRLLAHELAHQAFEGTRSAAVAPVWRKELANVEIFDAGSIKDADLLAYLKVLRDTGKIEMKATSRDKARGVVRKWREGRDAYGLSIEMKVLLIEQMLYGYTGNNEERAILTLLQKGSSQDLQAILPKVDADRLYKNFQGDELDTLSLFYDRVLVGGHKSVFTRKPLVFEPEAEMLVAAPYGRAALRAFVDDAMTRIGLVIRDRAVGRRQAVIDQMVRAEAPNLQAQLAALPQGQQATAARDMAADRSQKESQANTIYMEIDAAPTQAKKDTLGRKKMLLQGEVLLLDLALQTTARDIALGSPKLPAGTALTAAETKAAKEAIAPKSLAAVVAAAKGVAPPPPPKFDPGPLKGEKDTYEDKIRARIPIIIKGAHDRQAVNRTEKEHGDPTKARSMDDMQVIANQAKDEVDLVFGNFYDKGKVSAFQGDKRDASAKLISKGNLRDVWQVEQDQLKANPAYEKGSARFWLYYLIQNDGVIAEINSAHDASPDFGKDLLANNDEAKAIRKAGDPFVASDSKRLAEIGRGWDAYNKGKDIHIQLFKKPNAADDRKFLWDIYFVLMHEYLHKLKAGKYGDYAAKLGGEHSTEGNTLLEGVDSLLTEIVWSSAIKRAGTKAVREKVEPDAVKAGLAFDAKLLPKIPHRRYATYSNAVRLVGVVGLDNLYAAYFGGKIELIGGK